MPAKKRIGIIGAGGIVENSHLPALLALPNAEVCWVYDKNVERSRLISNMYDVSCMAEFTQAALDCVDVCLLTVPYGARKPFIESVAAAGKALYVEKPFAFSVTEHIHYAGLFPPGNLKVGFQRRYYPVVDFLKSIIQSGVFGALNTILFRQGNFTLKGGGGYLGDVALAGGGIVAESGIHALDQILCFTQATQVKVNQVKFIARKGIDYETDIVSDLSTPTGTLVATTQFSTLRNFKNGLTLQFEKAVVSCKLDADAYIRVLSHNLPSNGFRLLEESSHSQPYSSAKSFYDCWYEFLQQTGSRLGEKESAIELLTTKWIEEIYLGIQS